MTPRSPIPPTAGARPRPAVAMLPAFAMLLALAMAPIPAGARPEAPPIQTPTQTQNQTRAETPADRNAEVVRRVFADWAAGRGGFAGILAPDVVWTIHGSGPVAGTYRSREAFIEQASRPLISRLATPLVPRVHHIWAMGETVVIRFEAAATTTAGQPYRNQFVWIFRMREGVVVEAEAFLDLAAYQQVVEGSPPRQP